MVSAGKDRLKILFFSQRFPYPMDTGGKIRTGKTLEYLNSVFDITLISNVESPKDDPYLGSVNNLCSQFYPVPWTETKKHSWRFYMKVLSKTFSRYPVSVGNDYSPALERTLNEVMARERFDLLICDFLQPSINCQQVTGCPMLLFQHNVEAVIPRRHFEIAKDPVSRVFWWLQWKKMAKYEAAMCGRFDGIIAVSESDRQLMEEEYGARRVFAIPTGVDTEYFTPVHEVGTDHGLVFTGSMDWLPNEDALLYFARDILDKVKSEVPSVRLTVVGRNPSRRLQQELSRYPEITIAGRVPDVRPFIGSHAVYVIPLRIGGGTRIKAYEALAMGKAMVSTRVGVEGLPVRDGEHLLIADSPEEFARAVVTLLKDVDRRRSLGEKACRFVRENFSWAKAGEMFAEACLAVVDQGASKEKVRAS